MKKSENDKLLEEKIKMRLFLRAWYGEALGSIPKACAAIGVAPDKYYNDWRHSPVFKKELVEFDAAWRKELYALAAKNMRQGLLRGSSDFTKLFYKLEKLLGESEHVAVEGDVKLIVELDDGEQKKTELEKPSE